MFIYSNTNLLENGPFNFLMSKLSLTLGLKENDECGFFWGSHYDKNKTNFMWQNLNRSK